jgi:hypothetical protein
MVMRSLVAMPGGGLFSLSNSSLAVRRAHSRERLVFQEVKKCYAPLCCPTVVRQSLVGWMLALRMPGRIARLLILPPKRAKSRLQPNHVNCEL